MECVPLLEQWRRPLTESGVAWYGYLELDGHRRCFNLDLEVLTSCVVENSLSIWKSVDIEPIDSLDKMEVGVHKRPCS